MNEAMQVGRAVGVGAPPRPREARAGGASPRTTSSLPPLPSHPLTPLPRLVQGPHQGGRAGRKRGRHSRTHARAGQGEGHSVPVMGYDEIQHVVCKVCGAVAAGGGGWGAAVALRGKGG